MDSAIQNTPPPASGCASRPQLEVLEERLQRVEAILSRLIDGSTTQDDIGRALRDRGLHRHDTILSAPQGSLAASPYLDAEEAAAYLGVTVSSLYGIVERRHLTPLRGPRRRYRFTREMLDDYLHRRTDRR
jgi:excisionase family DNA binding protein